MKKRITAVFLAALFLLSALPFGTAADGFDFRLDFGEWDPPPFEDGYFDSGDYFYYRTQLGDAWILSYEGTEHAITLPTTLDGYPVTEIGPDAFSKNEAVTSVTVPEGIVTIQNFAFSKCPNLQTVSLPRSITLMEEGAFAYCASLTTIRVDDACPALTVRDGVLFDKAGETLVCYPARRPGTSYTVPEGVTVIDNGAFSTARDLVSVTLPDSLLEIKTDAFSDCTALPGLSLPAGLQHVAPGAFMGCAALTAFTVAADNPSLSAPDGVLLGNGGRTLLCYPPARPGTSYTVPEGVTVLASEAFADCTSLTALTLPKALYTVAEFAFYNCTGLRSLAFPANVTYIHPCAFQGCTSIERFDVDSNNWNFHAVDGVLFNTREHALARYPAARPDESYVVPAGTLNIQWMAFSDCAALRSVTLSNMIFKIGTLTFNNCPVLTRVDIHPRVKNINNRAFEDCPVLTIHGARASVAQDYAAAHNIPFVATGNAFGNVNGDNRINTADAVLVLQYGAELIDNTALDTTVADVNGDGKINTADAVLILQYAAGLIH